MNELLSIKSYLENYLLQLLVFPLFKQDLKIVRRKHWCVKMYLYMYGDRTFKIKLFKTMKKY